MKNILNKLAQQADMLDSRGQYKIAEKVDEVSRKLAEWTFMGGKSNVTPEERARHRMTLMGEDDPVLYQKLLAEEKVKEPEEKPKAQPQKAQPIVNYTKKQLLEALKKQTVKEDDLKSHLVPALNLWVNDNKSPAPDVYGSKNIAEILDIADKLGMLKKESSGFFSSLFD